MEAMSKATPKLPRIAIRTALDGRGLVEVVVEDGGRGMAPDVLDHAFASFFTTKPQGMGLGLATSRSMVGAHGAQLWATSQEGVGTTVHSTLPIAGRPVEHTSELQALLRNSYTVFRQEK